MELLFVLRLELVFVFVELLLFEFELGVLLFEL